MYENKTVLCFNREEIKNGSILYIIACNDLKDYKGQNGMYISALNDVYFGEAEDNYAKQRWRLTKLPNVANSEGHLIHEGDIVSIESDYDENSYLQTTEKKKENYLVSTKLRALVGLDEHCWIIVKFQNKI